MSIEVTHNVDDMDRHWAIWWSKSPLQETVDAIVVDTVLRLEDDEHGPDGKRWKAWSDNPPGKGYASTRGPGDKLMFASGDLRDSIESKRTGGAYIVGSDRDYAQVHQFERERRNQGCSRVAVQAPQRKPDPAGDSSRRYSARSCRRSGRPIQNSIDSSQMR